MIPEINTLNELEEFTNSSEHDKGVHCSKCGEKLNVFDITQNCSIHNVAGYGSDFDGDEIDLILCIDCMDQLIRDCKISPIKNREEMSYENKR